MNRITMRGPVERGVTFAVVGLALAAATASCVRQPVSSVDAPALRGLSDSAVGEYVRAATRKKSKFPAFADSQRLAIPDSTQPGLRLRHGPLAKIVALEDIEKYKKASDFDYDLAKKSGWRPVAGIEMNDPAFPGGFAYAKLGLINGVTNSLHITRDPRTGRWWAKMEPSKQTFAVEWKNHEGDPDLPAGGIPGVARWLWRDSDETAWIRCANGCCTLGDAAELPSGIEEAF
ncbi:MAG: hypothetical protein WKG32_03530 [Gemmatimonadaceae bacterium]